ncbi:MAG: hypothetical protein ACLFS3_01185 [Candidatus Aenigmatarchaeota archaeon]
MADEILCDKMDEEEIRKKISDGWIRARAFVEVMAVNREVTERALKKHIEKIEDQDGIEIYKEEMDEPEKVENISNRVPEAYSQIAEIEFMINSVKNLVKFSFLYGPSSVEVLEPKNVKLGVGELQDISNTVAALVHQYASQGAGGIVTSPD